MEYHFKTSYVTVYLRDINLAHISINISKHRMLLFISDADYPLERLRNNFKTSYVTVYPNVPKGKAAFTIFQNIVCYCLSDLSVFAHLPDLDFKTSYVTVYHRHHTALLMAIFNFKTSYVTVYLQFRKFLRLQI